ncbi:MAG: rod shape-determining protein MreC [Deltaproteobacteria bacterium HGW-Deltaproteobacteria-10]|nr:MAG: rod shape-determining protein MreC [Deltaproteobacteria bacterium HGW-Deltaproteobacteria-10]
MFSFRNFKTIIFIVILLATVLVVLSYNLRQRSPAGLATKVVLEAASPVQNILDACVKSISDPWYRYLFLVGIEEENRNLKKKINDMKSQLISYQEGYLEAQRLRSLLALQDDNDFDFVTARVIGRAQVALSQTILINKGSADGLNAGQPVMATQGLVGRVIDASWHSAKVLPLIDQNSNIDAIVQRNRIQGIIRGAGSRGCVLKYVSKTQDVRDGDIIVSSGIGGVFPKGMLIGQVTHVDRQEAGLFLRIYVTPSIDFSKLEEVSVATSDEDENEGKK